MPTIAIPNPGPADQAFQFTLIPKQGTDPEKLILKNTTGLWVYDGTTLTEVTDVDYPALTVWGVAYLDGTVYVLDDQGQVFGCDLLDPLSWSALNFISANSEGGTAIAIARHLNYIIVFKDSSIEYLYNAGAPAPGSPLGKMVNSMVEVGCAAAGSIAYHDNIVIFMSQSQAKGRNISVLSGFTPEIISTPFVDRILNANSLTEVYAYVVKSNGHIFYVLSLPNPVATDNSTNLTLVYDFTTREWHEWGYTEVPALTAGTGVAGTATASGSRVTITTSTAHGLASGTLIYLNEYLLVEVISTTVFEVEMATPVTGAVEFFVTTQVSFPAAFYTRGASADYLLSRDTGHVWEFSPDAYDDAGLPILVEARTKLEDWGTMTMKIMRKMEVVGDQEDTVLHLRYTDDDYQTWRKFRRVNLNNQRARVMATGSTRRRGFDVRHFDNTPLRLIALEVEFDIGAR